MIPKIIHLIWDSKHKERDIYTQCCLRSIEKYCPDYEVRFWYISNYDTDQNDYLKFFKVINCPAFISDYMRFDILNQYGGIYMDTDVILTKNIDELLEKYSDKIITATAEIPTKGAPLEIIDAHMIISPPRQDFYDATMKELVKVFYTTIISIISYTLLRIQHKYLNRIYMAPVDFLNPISLEDRTKLSMNKNISVDENLKINEEYIQSLHLENNYAYHARRNSYKEHILIPMLGYSVSYEILSVRKSLVKLYNKYRKNNTHYIKRTILDKVLRKCNEILYKLRHRS